MKRGLLNRGIDVFERRFVKTHEEYLQFCTWHMTFTETGIVNQRGGHGRPFQTGETVKQVEYFFCQDLKY